jgi:hypothetical protein
LFGKEGRSVAFKFDQDSDEGGDVPEIKAGHGSIESIKPQVEEAKAPPKSSKWWEKVKELDISVQASFIGFAVQCLMSVQKWESMVDISNRLNSATENAFAAQLLPFIIFAQTTLY